MCPGSGPGPVFGQLGSISGLLSLVCTGWMQGTLCPVLSLWEGHSLGRFSHLPRAKQLGGRPRLEGHRVRGGSHDISEEG